MPVYSEMALNIWPHCFGENTIMSVNQSNFVLHKLCSVSVSLFWSIFCNYAFIPKQFHFGSLKVNKTTLYILYKNLKPMKVF